MKPVTTVHHTAAVVAYGTQQPSVCACVCVCVCMCVRPHTVVPRDSSWFWTMDENRELVPLEQQDLWKVCVCECVCACIKASASIQQWTQCCIPHSSLVRVPTCRYALTCVLTCVLPLSHTYTQEDWLGLRRLSESGRLSFEEAPGRHMQFSMEWFESTIMWGYLAGESDDTTSATAALKA